MRTLRSLLVLSFLFSTTPALALENDAALKEMPGQDANLTSDAVHRAPTDHLPAPTDSSNEEDVASTDGSTEASVETIDGKKVEEEKEVEMELFVPKPRRHVWKDEVATGSSENGSTSGSSSGGLTEKLNKISGGASTS